MSIKQSGDDFDRFSATRRYYAFDFLPGTHDIVYSANTSGQFNVWRQSPPADGTPGAARQLSGFLEWTVRHLAPLPNGRSILAFADKDGDENYQIFTVDAENGWQKPLVFKPEVRHEWGIESVSPDGRFVAYSSNERARKDMDVVVAAISTGETRSVLADGGLYTFGYWSPDGKRATVVEILASDDFNLHLVDLRSGKKRKITPHKEKARYIPGPWSVGGDGFYLITDEGREFMSLYYTALKDGVGGMRRLETPKRDIEDVVLSPNGRVLAWVENVGGYSHISFRDVRTGKMIGRPISTGGVLLPGWFDNARIIKFSPDGNRLACLLSTSTRPGEICVVSSSGLDMVPYTNGFVGNIPSARMIRPVLVEYDSFDHKVPAFLYRPKIVRGRRAPVVLSIHGGPESQERPLYGVGLYQYLLRRGVGILAPNIRGSTGYGKGYQRLIHHDWGGGELRDMEYGVKYLRGLDWVDEERIGVFGGSFGGFATLSAVTRLPQYWRVAVDVFGPSNLVTFTRSVPEHWKRLMADWVGDPEKEADFLLNRSPISYIDNARCPILIIQGANDPRVVKNESDQVVERLRSRGVEVEYVVFPDEGHGFTKQRNEFTAFKKIAGFILERLLG